MPVRNCITPDVISVSPTFNPCNTCTRLSVRIPIVIMNQITEPLEQNINGIPGIRSLSSVSSQGSSRITVEFELSVDMETAANDVRDKVSRAQRYLPRDCDPPTVSKADADASPIMQIAIRSNKRSLMELSEIAELTVKERLQTIENVSGVDIWGQKRYSMRLWLDPIKMAGYGVTPMDVKNAVDNENVELPSGSIEGNTISLSIRTLGLMHTAKEFNDLIIKEDNNNIVRFSDIGRAEVAPEDLRSLLKKNGEPMVMTVIIPQPGANHIEIADEAYKRIEQLQKDLPEDVTIEMMYDNTRFIRASFGDMPCSIRTYIFSATTIASSTTRPTESTTANIVNTLTENPEIYITKKAPTNDTGITTTGTSVTRQSRWNKKIINTTKRKAS